MYSVARPPVEAAKKHPDAQGPLDAWYKVAEKATWKNLAELHQTYPNADYVAPNVVFNIKGNSYRLIAKIEFQWQMIFIKHVLTHDGYDKEDWKK
jgi:mRNA interferase HigB